MVDKELHDVDVCVLCSRVEGCPAVLIDRVDVDFVLIDQQVDDLLLAFLCRDVQRGLFIVAILGGQHFLAFLLDTLDELCLDALARQPVYVGF